MLMLQSQQNLGRTSRSMAQKKTCQVFGNPAGQLSRCLPFRQHHQIVYNGASIQE